MRRKCFAATLLLSGLLVLSCGCGNSSDTSDSASETASTAIDTAAEQSTEDYDVEDTTEFQVIIRGERLIPFDGQEVTLAPVIYDAAGKKVEDTTGYAFQWSVYSDSDDDYQDIEGANEDTYSFQADPGTVGYAITVTDPRGAEDTAYFTPYDKNGYFLSLIEDSEYISYDGEDTTIHVTLYDGDGRLIEDTSDYSFQWYNISGDDGSYTKIDGATESDLTFQPDQKMLEDGDYVGCLTTNTSTGNTDTVTFSGEDKSTYYEVEVDGEKAIDLNGENVTVEALAYDADGNQLTDEDIQYQWYAWSDEESDYQAMEGETQASLTFAASEENLKDYQVIVTNGDESATGYGYYTPMDQTDDQAVIEDTVDAILTIDDTHITLRDEKYIVAARTAYDALTPEQQKLVPDYLLDTLTDAEERYEALKTE